MEKILNFLGNYYYIFDSITVFLSLSLIGYFINQKNKKETPFKIKRKEYSMQNIVGSLQELGNISLQERVNKNANIKNDHNVK